MADELQDVKQFAEWSRQLAADNPNALRDLFDATYKPLVRFASRLVGDDAIARDLTQDAFVRIWERRSTLDPSLSLRALLYRTVRNLALNHLRDLNTRRNLLEDPSVREVSVTPRRLPQPDDKLYGDELAARLEQFIAELPPRQKEALRLSRFDGLNHQEIAEVMGCAPRTVNNHLVRALDHLRTRLAELGTVVASVAWWTA